MQSRALAPVTTRPVSRIDQAVRGGPTYAAIDFGSSSAEMLVQTVGADGRLRTVLDRKIGTALGKDLPEDKSLPEANQQRGIDCLKQFLADAGKYGVRAEDIPLIATAAVRNAPNGKQYLARVAKELGLKQARVLTGEQEAQLGYAGAVSVFGDKGRTMKLATLDLGGGSFQMAVGTGSKLEQGASTQVGSNWVLENLLPPKLLTDADFARADAEVKKVAALPLDPASFRGRTLVAVGGVARFLRAHFKKDVVTRAEIDAFRRKLGSIPPDQRSEEVRRGKDMQTLVSLGLETPRTDQGIKLPASCTLLLRVMDALGIDSLRVSPTDARNVLVQEQMKRSQKA